ncbi:hypothetical protein PR202_ga11514 [Eleusine coracana subsp. coracana]|uniref:C3H1-type domain-containing protein n=1 Tax=Eleusine coracana subsp. coracana TaxID=191504 RepID=A0AAV5C9P9_ELECO|nr:hypothetical protein PR202_ga11514 [Eleusine coracana subsp. coracana]
MMMMGEGAAHAPPWQQQSSPASGGAGEGDDAYTLLAALRRYLPSNEAAAAYEDDNEDDDAVAALDAYACDEFRMYEFKVRRCARGRSHDWTDCPFAHPGEKARRRDPRRFHYSGAACPDFRKGGCKRGDGCEFAHGVFECWLHPARYRTQPCKDGTACRRRVCFFAHTPDQLRVVPSSHQSGGGSSSPRGVVASSSLPLAESYDGSPLRRQAFESYLTKSKSMMMSSSPTSTLVSPPRSPPSESPPVSPDGAALRRGACWSGVNDVVASLRQLRLGGGSPRSAPSGPSFLAGGYPYGSPKSTTTGGLYSLPSTPTGGPAPVTITTSSGATIMTVDRLNLGFLDEVLEPPVMERVESGRALREKVFERLSKEGTVPHDASAAATADPSAAPDVGWVTDLVN